MPSIYVLFHTRFTRKYTKIETVGYVGVGIVELRHVFFIYLARSVNLPTGLYIFLALISSSFSFFSMSKDISVSAGQIFTTFSPNGRNLREFS